jgi:MFS family permease
MTANSMTTKSSDPIWTRAFTVLCLAQFLGYAHHFVLQPTLPLYIISLGGTPFIVGLVIAAFGATSVIFRPIIGAWADRWHGSGVMLCGILFLAASVLFCFLPFVGATMLANALRGIGWGAMNTGGYTLLATTAPPSRRGEASGYYSGVQASGTILFPAFGLWILDAPLGGYHAAFAFSIALALIAAGVGAAVARPAGRPVPGAAVESSRSWWGELFTGFDRNIVLAASLLFCLQLSLPCFTSFIVLYAKENAVADFGWFFVITGITSLLARPLLGRVSDQIGCGRSLIAAFVLEVAGLLLLPAFSALAGMMFCGVLYMMGSAIGGSRILALAMERAPAERRGRAMASFSMAFPLSNGTGALLNGLVVDLVGYTWMYVSAAALCAAGLALTVKHWQALK